MDSLDTIFFAILAILFFARLWTLFGRDDFNPPDRDNLPNPFGPPDVVVFPPAKDPLKHPDSVTPDISGVTEHGFAVASLAGALDQWRALDPTFDEKIFLSGAKTAFEAILEAYAQGDLSWAQRLMTEEVLRSFEADIYARQGAGQKLTLSIDRFLDTEITGAHVNGTTATFTVRFTTLQKRALYDTMGHIVSGDPQKATEMEDQWVFSRDSRAQDPNWRLIATRAL